TTLTEVLQKLQEKGYDNELTILGKEKMQCKNSNKTYTPNELTIIKVFRFEGISDPADSSALYIFEDEDGNKLYAMDAYGVYSDEDKAEGFVEFLKAVKVDEKQDIWS